MDKDQISKIRIEIALGKTFKQVANEFNIPLTKYKKIPRIYPRKAVVRLLFQYNNEQIAQMAQIPVEIVEQIRQEQKQNEALLRIHNALGTPHEQIAKELDVAFSTVSGRKREIKNLYSREMIIDLLKSHDDAEIVELAQIPIEIVEQIRRETQEEERLLRNLIAIEASEKEISKILGLTSRRLIKSRKARLGKVYTRKEIEDLLEENSNRRIEEITQVSEDIVAQIKEAKTISESYYTMDTKRLKNSNEEKGIRTLVALGRSNTEIGIRYHYHELSIRNIKFSFGMYSRIQINNLLDLYSDEEIASIADINFLTVKQIREEEQGKNKNRNKSKTENIVHESEIRNLVAQNVTLEEIALIVHFEVVTLKDIKSKLGVYSSIQIIRLLEIRDEEEVAKITKVDLDIIAQIKEKVQNKHKEEEMKIQQGGMKRNAKQQREQKLRIAFAKGESYTQIQMEFNYASVKSVAAIKSTKNIFSRRQICDLMNSDKTNEQVAQIVQIPIELVMEIREEKHKESQELKKACETELERLNKRIKAIKKENISRKTQQSIDVKITKILNGYQGCLTEVDYAFIAYAYLRIGMRHQCQEVAEKYLKIENYSMEEVVNRIEGIIEAERFRREKPIILIAPNRHKEMEER